MRGRCERFGSEMCDFSALSTEKQELVKMFVQYLQSDKHKKHGHELGHGHHGKFGRFGKHGHGKHHGHGMHGGRHGPHGHCGPHGHHGPHGHRGPHGHGGHGRPHCHRGRHGLHGKHGKFWAQWSIDLTHDESDGSTQPILESARNPSPPPGETATNQEQEAGANCKCSRFGRHHGGRFGKRKLHKINQVPVAEISSQTDDNTEETQDNLTEMVENINIVNTE